MQLMASFAAVHTTTITTTQALFELAALSSFQDELRNEVLAMLEENGGTWNGKASVNRLWKVDSLLKKAQRHNPPGFGMFTLLYLHETQPFFLHLYTNRCRSHSQTLASFFRYVLKPITLSSNFQGGPPITLPVGTTVISSFDVVLFVSARLCRLLTIQPLKHLVVSSPQYHFTSPCSLYSSNQSQSNHVRRY